MQPIRCPSADSSTRCLTASSVLVCAWGSVHVWVGTCVGLSGGQRLTLGVFLNLFEAQSLSIPGACWFT